MKCGIDGISFFPPHLLFSVGNEGEVTLVSVCMMSFVCGGDVLACLAWWLCVCVCVWVCVCVCVCVCVFV